MKDSDLKQWNYTLKKREITAAEKTFVENYIVENYRFFFLIRETFTKIQWHITVIHIYEKQNSYFQKLLREGPNRNVRNQQVVKIHKNVFSEI